jgi:hypothetical protein
MTIEDMNRKLVIDYGHFFRSMTNEQLEEELGKLLDREDMDVLSNL